MRLSGSVAPFNVMINSRKLGATLAVFSGLASAADPSLIRLVMPDAKVLVGVNAGKILSSPMMQEITTKVKEGNPVIQQMFAEVGFDLARDLHEIVIASTGEGRNPPTLILASGNFDAAKFASFLSNGRTPTTFEGVAIMKGTGSGPASVAVLGDHVAIAGDLDQVQAAIHRNNQAVAPNLAIWSKAEAISRRYDVWLISTASMSGAASGITDPNMRQAAQLLESIEEVSGGMNWGPGLNLALEARAHTAKDAKALADSLGVLVALASAKPQGGPALKPDPIKLTVEGRIVRLSLSASEEELRQAYQAQMARRTMRPGLAPQPHTAAGGLTIQSSDKDMGTISVPPSKQ